MPGIDKLPAETTEVETTSVVLIFGPTAVGKTELLSASVFQNSEIINADSMQVYRGLDIGTAKPGPEFLAGIRHHLIDIRDPSEQFHAGEFVELADAAAGDISRRGRLPVICGGTGFYFKNFIYGLPEAPASDETVRAGLQAELETKGPEALFKRLSEVDAVSAARINANDRYRILRALEVYESTGRPLSEFEIPSVPRPEYETLLIGLNRKREELYERINLRVDQMFDEGIESEVRRLRAEGCIESSPGMKGIGYREFFIAEKEGLDEGRLRELIKRNSRRYAKRQITWFKQLDSINWFNPEDISGITACINSFLQISPRK